MKTIIKCGWCKEDFEAPHINSKYCSTICRSRIAQHKHGKAAKPFKCHLCGKPFKRRSAKNSKCIPCREKLQLAKDSGAALPKDVDLRCRPNTNSEDEMIKKFLLNK